MLAVDRYYYTNIHYFESKLLVKNAFAHCRVPFPVFHTF